VIEALERKVALRRHYVRADNARLATV
jgi:hypothetical protein